VHAALEDQHVALAGLLELRDDVVVGGNLDPLVDRLDGEVLDGSAGLL
jgi:hypothetical protein